MAVTVINLSDPVSTFVTKTNTVSSDVGDKSALTTSAKSNLVVAINEINTQLAKVDSADVVQLVKSSLQKDSANAIGFDSAQGRFFVPPETINTSMIEPLAVVRGRIAADAIDGTKLADEAVNSEHFVDGSIDSEHLASLVISTGKIQADAVTEAKIGDDAVGSVQLKTLSTLLIKDSAGSTLKTIHGAGA